MNLKTDRLLLRKFTLDDLDELAFITADAEVMRFSLKGPLTREETEQMLKNRILAHYEKYGFGLFAMIRKEDGQLIGLSGLITQQIDGEELVELAYRLHPAYWGQGFAYEGALAICHYAFDTLGLEQLISIIEPKNGRSLKLARSIGMHFWKDTSFHERFVHILALDKIAIRPYDSQWPAEFEKEKKRLKEAFKGLDIEFHHIGSTAIPGCSAKPIIDILGVAADLAGVDRYNDAMEKLHFEAMGENGIKKRRFFRRHTGVPVHLHIFQDANPEIVRHLRFRDYLRAHPLKMEEYVELKKTLAAQYPGDRSQYTQAKDKFIAEIVAAASKKH